MALDRFFSRALHSRRARGRLSILSYCGWGSPEAVELTGRVVLPRTLRPPQNADPRWRNFGNIVRRLLSREISGVEVHGTLAGAEAHSVSDEDGFFTLKFVLPPSGLRFWPLDIGWHTAELTIPGREGVSKATVQVIDDQRCAYGVISDLDDTVIQSDVTSVGRMLFTVLTGNARTRSPFPGVGALYRALVRHASTPATVPAAGTPSAKLRNPVFYVSSSPWNFFDLLWQFLEYRRIPLGPLFLRNWGADLLGGHATYKLAVIERIFTAYPRLRFVLAGDSGEHDPEIYAEVVRKFPGRVLGIYIRDVSQGQEHDRVLGLREELSRLGVDMVLARDSFAAASHAMALGLITPGELRSVAQSVEKSLHLKVLPF
ncbi:DUF2183 domain-containing protein [Deinococcus sp. KNUC1210]|uniref:App1 family protein n=1 Tax=Deinococcus sp. KNUC1210 TaxID=2917691 RepID=UPI001EF00486|nr:phosphatase domain-containing protein [Deinococcus sp. KNUC1210]ULH16847.1 DUF2183 domain-containing protein [Deinococcus sp. KNUC1210]